jgi:succinate dehydrogenase/fumarate reductase flavoprotein subunit
MALATDVLVLGGGLAAHRAAVAARETGADVAMLYTGTGASPHVICFNVPLGIEDGRDSAAVYADDMVRGGAALNDRPLVEALAADTPTVLAELEKIGVDFARRDGRHALRHLAGSTYPRSVYCAGGLGSTALRRLDARARELGVRVESGWKIIGLLLDRGAVAGGLAVRRRSGELLAVRARAVVLAMGGLGRLYEDSTYPPDVAADGYAFAYDAGAMLVDMEFVQFEPTIVVHPAGCKGMEMPTAMLGDGAHLKNAAGERFMFRANPEHGEKRIEKARMSLVIQREIDEGRGLPDGTVLFDTTVLPPELLEGYVSHVKRLRTAGLEPTREAPHVRPAAHSHMGGVRIDARGWSGIVGLWAAGEAAGGVHGASRLAGNSGSDALVFGARAGRAAAEAVLRARGVPERREPPADATAAPRIDARPRDWAGIEAAAAAPLRSAIGRTGRRTPDDVKKAVRLVMGRDASLYRHHAALTRGLADLDELAREVDTGLGARDVDEAVSCLEARNMVLVARMVVSAALARTESRGAHQRTDFPSRDDPAWLRHLAIVRSADGGMRLETVPVVAGHPGA